MVSRATVFFLFNILLSCQTQFIQIHDVSNNPGALVINSGEGRIINGIQRLLHIINLNEYRKSISIMENVINNINGTNTDFSKLIYIKLADIKSLFESLIPNHRNTRAIETLGSIIKFIAGNPDAEDLRSINSKLNSLAEINNDLGKENEKQIRINLDFQDKIQTLIDQTNYHNSVLSQLISQKQNIISENHKIAILFQMDIIINSMKSIQNTIMLAKLNIVNREILSIKELKLIGHNLEIAGIKFNNLDEICTLLTTTIIYHEENIIISVNIPYLKATIYRKLIVKPMPINNKIVTIDHQTLLTNENETYAIKTGCLETSKLTLCEPEQTLDISDDKCLTPLIKGHKGQCAFLEIPPVTKIEMLSYGTLVVQAVQELRMSSTCGINEKVLKGNFLITFHNCTLIVQNKIFENSDIEFQHPIISSLDIQQIQETHLDRNFNLSHLHHLNLETRQHVQGLKLKYYSTTSVIGFIIIIIAVIMIIGFKYPHLLGKSFMRRTGRANLEDGGVKDRNTSNILPPTLTALTERVRINNGSRIPSTTTSAIATSAIATSSVSTSSPTVGGMHKLVIS